MSDTELNQYYDSITFTLEQALLVTIKAGIYDLDTPRVLNYLETQDE